MQQPNTTTNPNTLLQPTIDILFEYIAAILTTSPHHQNHHIHVTPTQNFRRNYKNDIVNIQQHQIENKDQDYDLLNIINIITSRNNTLDHLPQALIDQKPLKTPNESPEQWNHRLQQYWKQLPQRIKNAQNFFKPIEVEQNKIRIQKEITESNLLQNKTPLLQKIWHNHPTKTPHQKRFINTLHLIPTIVGNPQKTKHLIQHILNKNIQLSYHTQTQTTLPQNLQPQLGKTTLGFTTNTSKKIYQYIPICTLTIYGLTKQEYSDYQNPKTQQHQLLNTIIQHYFPLDLDIQLNYQINTKNTYWTHPKNNKIYQIPTDQFILNQNPETGEGCLGISTRLGKKIELN